MIKKKHSHPQAFNTEWRTVSKFESIENYNFNRYVYKIFDEVYEKNDKAFKDAYDSYIIWSRLKRK